MSLHRRARGNVGEDIACDFLNNKGFTIVERNYLKKWGELDIIAKKDSVLHFFEVKSVTGVFSETFFDIHRPEDNVDGWKTKHLRKMIETYLFEREGGIEIEFRFHILCVYMNKNGVVLRIKWLKDIIL